MVNLNEAAKLAAGKLKLAEEAVEKRKRGLREHDRRTAVCAEEAERVVSEIEDLHRDGADPDTLDELRERLVQVRVRQGGLISERDHLLRLLKEARDAHTDAQAWDHIARLELLHAEGVEIIRTIWDGLDGVRLAWQELREVKDQARRVRDSLRDSPVEHSLPTFEWLTHTWSRDVESLESVFAWLDKARAEQQNRDRRRPGGIVPGAYSQDQQERRRAAVASGSTRWNRG